MPDVGAYLRGRTFLMSVEVGHRARRAPTEEITMFTSDQFVQAEIEYRRARTRKELAASRGGRSRASWLRRMAAADKSVS